MSELKLMLDEKQVLFLKERAKSMDISVEELLKKMVNDLMNSPEKEFHAAMRYVLEKNRELYKRLA